MGCNLVCLGGERPAGPRAQRVAHAGPNARLNQRNEIKLESAQAPTNVAFRKIASLTATMSRSSCPTPAGLATPAARLAALRTPATGVLSPASPTDTLTLGVPAADADGGVDNPAAVAVDAAGVPGTGVGAGAGSWGTPNERRAARPRGVAPGTTGVVEGRRFLSGEEATEGCFCSIACFFFSRIADRIELVAGADEAEAEGAAVGAAATGGRGRATGTRGWGAWGSREKGQQAEDLAGWDENDQNS